LPASPLACLACDKPIFEEDTGTVERAISQMPARSCATRNTNHNIQTITWFGSTPRATNPRSRKNKSTNYELQQYVSSNVQYDRGGMRLNSPQNIFGGSRRLRLCRLCGSHFYGSISGVAYQVGGKSEKAVK
jgi:hypothetical protein